MDELRGNSNADEHGFVPDFSFYPRKSVQIRFIRVPIYEVKNGIADDTDGADEHGLASY